MIIIATTKKPNYWDDSYFGWGVQFAISVAASGGEGSLETA